MTKGGGWLRMPHELLLQLARLPLGGYSRRVLDVLLRFTWGFRRTSVPISRETLCEYLGTRSYSSVDRALCELERWGVISIERKGRGRGRARVITLLPPAEWLQPMPPSGRKKDRSAGHFNDDGKRLESGPFKPEKTTCFEIKNDRQAGRKNDRQAGHNKETKKDRERKGAAASASAPANGSGYGGFSEAKDTLPEPPSWRPGGECEQSLRLSVYDTDKREAWCTLVLQDPAAARQLIATATRGLPEEVGNLAEARRRLLSLLAKEVVAP